MGCGNYSGVKTIPGRKLFAEMRYWFFITIHAGIRTQVTPQYVLM